MVVASALLPNIAHIGSSFIANYCHHYALDWDIAGSAQKCPNRRLLELIVFLSIMPLAPFEPTHL